MNGWALAATSKGLYRHPANTTSGAWTPVLKPSGCSAAGGTPDTVNVTDVAVRPGTGGQVVDAVVGWRAGSNCNGFFQSTNGGAVVQSPHHRWRDQRERPRPDLDRLVGERRQGLRGRRSRRRCSTTRRPTRVARSCRASTCPRRGLAGPWNKIAEWRNLANGGSALKAGRGYHPGVQAWYNQFLAVDPQNANHIYLGLEEVFESTDGGGKWTAVGPYWNFGMPCSDGPTA